MKDPNRGSPNDPIGAVYDRVLGFAVATPQEAYRSARGGEARNPGIGVPGEGAAAAGDAYRRSDAFPAPPRGVRHGDATGPAASRKLPARRWNDVPGRRPPESAGAHPGRRWNDAPRQPSRARFASVAGSAGFFVPDQAPAPVVARGLPEPLPESLPSRDDARQARLPGAGDDYLAPHLERAARIRDRMEGLQRQTAFVLAILDRVDAALVAVTGEGEVRFSNAAARECLAGGSGLHLAGGRLAAASAERQGALAQAVRNAARFGARTELTFRDAGGQRHCWVLVAPLAEGATASADDERLALLLVHDPDSPAPSPVAFLRETFGATAAEARLAEALADGRTAEEFAEGAKLSMNTVRTQIRALLTKTCLNRQADLLRLLARLPRLRGPRASA